MDADDLSGHLIPIDLLNRSVAEHGHPHMYESIQESPECVYRMGVMGLWLYGRVMRPYGLWIDALRSAAIASTDNLPPELGFLLPELGQPTQVLSDPSPFLMRWCDR